MFKRTCKIKGIYAVINSDHVWKRISANCAAAAHSADAQKSVLANKFRGLGIASVEIDFSGSGDSGNIDYITFTPISLADDILRQEVEDWAYTFLEGRGIDWYNNDGGQGTITFDITASKFEYRIDVNKIFTATEDRGEEEI
jgi:hypothetical protein